jgi:two-component system phosphate regulon sensor histidine kinase PhoR
MADANNIKKLGNPMDLGYTQALKYGQDLARLYTQEKAKRRDLELANQKLYAILETAPNGLAVLDETMTIVEANPRFEALVEKKGVCVNRSLVDVLPAENLVAILQTASEEGQRFVEVEATLVEPVERSLHIIAAPLIAGNHQGWVISLHDITEHKRLEGLKEEFINIAAHELRTPLAIILGYVSVLREDLQESDAAVALTAIDAILKASDRLTLVIDELVGFAAAKSRSADDVGTDHFDLCNVVRHSANSVSHQATLKNVEVSIETPDDALMVTGDRVILAQALGHLLDNAVKFNHLGGQISVRAFKDNTEIIVEIVDTGIGIPLTDLNKIFQMFYQVEEHMTRAEGGLGMGLAIAQRGVELHGGHIEVASTIGQGSSFRVVLPSSGEQIAISSASRLDTAHKQTLAYGRDLARAVMARQTLTQRMNSVSALGQQLLARLERMSQIQRSGDTAPLIEEARALVKQLLDEAT